jgi:hypothetical protein
MENLRPFTFIFNLASSAAATTAEAVNVAITTNNKTASIF